MKEIAKYLLSLSAKKQRKLLTLIADGGATTQGNEPAACNKKPRPALSEGDTPFGYWHCDGTEWVWVPEFGR